MFRIGGLTLLLVSLSGAAYACGWWGDGESLDSDAVVVRPQGIVELDPVRQQDPDYLIDLGNRYRNAATTQGESYSMAVHYYQLAADLEHAGARYNLGMMYQMGLGVRADLARAARFYALAARQGNVDAQHHLGEMYLAGQGVERDMQQGLFWLEEAALQRHVDLFARLANLYWRGDGVPRQSTRAWVWARLAMDSGDAKMALRSQEIFQALDANQRKEAQAAYQEISRQWSDDPG